jgi:hypothetical protein
MSVEESDVGVARQMPRSLAVGWLVGSLLLYPMMGQGRRMEARVSERATCD